MAIDNSFSSAGLVGQRALVTGGNGGIGAAVSQALAAAGVHVAINYVGNAESAEQLVADIRASGGSAFAVAADVSQEDQVLAMYRRIDEAFGGIDILINNAGLQRDAAFHELTMQDWNKVINVNLTGQFLCAREAVKRFLKQGVNPEVSRAAGKIVCISSVHDVIPWAGHVNYAASKGGVMLMMKSLAQEVAPHRIRINSISPGAIRTQINVDAWSTPEAESALLKLIPYKRVGDTVDIADAVVWMVSDAADYVTGTTLYVDGGMTLYPEFAGGG